MVQNSTPMPSANGERIGSDLDTLSRFAEGTKPGWTRQVFSEPYRDERFHILELMSSAGLDAHIDGAGNVFGRLVGKHSHLPPLMTGSHTDTVHGGGRFDGIIGVLGAIESARALREAGIQLDRDLVVIDFLGEEANPFGVSCLGSRAISGQLRREHLDRTDGESDVTMGETMAQFGLDPDQVLRSVWEPGSLHGYIELHIEQGPLLERSGRKIGVVTAIAGIERLLAQFAGQADHAGTMPMEGRRDALIAAAEAVLTIEREACGAPIRAVSTTGRIESSPGSFNIVPDEAKIWAEVRSVDDSWLVGARGRISRQIADQASNRGVDVMLEWLNDQRSVPTTPSVQDVIGSSADALGLSWEAVPSGAGHDAAHMTHLGPLGMVFVPSVDGRSHVPEEFTENGDVVNGVNVLMQSLIAMDKQEFN